MKTIGKSTVTSTGFDFDGVLDYNQIAQLLARSLVLNQNPPFVITKRSPDISDEVYSTTDSLGIPRENVYFTSNQSKSPLINQLNINLFYDDDPDNIRDITTNTHAKAVLVKTATA